jgi:hypothetical protein
MPKCLSIQMEFISLPNPSYTIDSKGGDLFFDFSWFFFFTPSDCPIIRIIASDKRSDISFRDGIIGNIILADKVSYVTFSIMFLTFEMYQTPETLSPGHITHVPELKGRPSELHVTIITVGKNITKNELISNVSMCELKLILICWAHVTIITASLGAILASASQGCSLEVARFMCQQNTTRGGGVRRPCSEQELAIHKCLIIGVLMT